MDAEFSAISLDRQGEYRALLGQTPELASDYSFVNLWAWAEVYGLSWAWSDGLVWIRQNRPQPIYWAPVGPWSEVDWPRMMPRLTGRRFSRLPESLALTMAKASPKARLLTERQHWDYLYSVPELVALSGNRFHAKQNLLRQFQTGYLWQYLPLDRDLVTMVLAMQSEWCAWRDCEHSPELAAEDRAIARAMQAFAELQPLLGGVIVVDGRIVAFTVGEELSADTVLIHFEKGLGSYKGIYQAINREFLAQHQGFSLVNREPDMGNDGLRQAKLSYNPVSFLRKYELLWP